ncbi:hypothetical protein O6H91_17G088000 [Diphasiastrum complanatum]|uniref:Uncharacterized protein n=1 Tax=Diphasiastrum complanatum TaxID=34168 RepID=A0ACC2B9X3_DIPCM|nr:hypothetical protein O6H91_17G088000 [Diphasiastrum complanatum]
MQKATLKRLLFEDENEYDPTSVLELGSMISPSDLPAWEDVQYGAMESSFGQCEDAELWERMAAEMEAVLQSSSYGSSGSSGWDSLASQSPEDGWTYDVTYEHEGFKWDVKSADSYTEAMLDVSPNDASCEVEGCSGSFDSFLSRQDCEGAVSLGGETVDFHHTYTGLCEDLTESERGLMQMLEAENDDVSNLTEESASEFVNKLSHNHQRKSVVQTSTPLNRSHGSMAAVAKSQSQLSVGNDRTQFEHNPNLGVQLVQLLVAAAEAVACRDKSQANICLQELKLMVSPYGDSMQRLTYYFVEALTARSQGLESPYLRPLRVHRFVVDERLKQEAFQLVYQLCPYISFGHYAANRSILEAFDGEAFVHIVDLGMTSGLQWPSLLQALASRTGVPPRLVRITAIGSSSPALVEVGESLGKIAASLNLPFKFRTVTDSVENLQKSTLDINQGEAVAINSIFQLHSVVKESRISLKSVLKSIYDLSPKVLTVVEQDAWHNGPFFLGRYMEALHYYAAIFDSMDAILPRSSPERVKMEQFYFAQEIMNIISCEGPDRVERHERSDQWRRRLSRAGFHSKPLRVLNEARKCLTMSFQCEGYTLVEEKGCIVLGWKGKPIVSASTWRC